MSTSLELAWVFATGATQAKGVIWAGPKTQTNPQWGSTTPCTYNMATPCSHGATTVGPSYPLWEVAWA
eukprot:1561041-Pyramimonas_sp.AAC.1